MISTIRNIRENQIDSYRSAKSKLLNRHFRRQSKFNVYDNKEDFKKLLVKYARIEIILLFFKSFRLPMSNPLQNVTLIMEKDILKRELFSSRLMMDGKKTSFRIPGNLTQEHLPINFKYYNCLFLILQNLNKNMHFKEFTKNIKQNSRSNSIDQGTKEVKIAALK